MEEGPDRAQLRRYLAERNQYPARTAEIDAELHRVFNRKVAILALDMCGFSRMTAQYGIVHFLAMIDQMEQGAIPAVQANGGRVIKLDADNLFAIFTEPKRALEAALDIFRAFEAINAVVPENRDIRGSIGIGYGDVLVIDEADLYGNEMNIASKLGEDCAGPFEILLTAAAHAALPPDRYEFAPTVFPIGGMQIEAQRFLKSRYKRLPAGPAGSD
ncbi:MAG TPA: adenylate/guanylate cyclase domain-containing protein [Chthoniobacteraceae bacterium]|jgi:class 3 adenylate cyclase|nr:adenylate/guanylate cyclase domain-containing protein [Chthoniobacteraceae bacterium]